MLVRKIKVLLGAVATLAIATATAAAYDLELSPAGEAEAVSDGRVIFTRSSINIECVLTLELDLAGIVVDADERSVQLGEVIDVQWSECVGGEWRAFLGLEWAVDVVAVLGTLPTEATGLGLEIPNFALQLSVFGGFVNCLWAGPLPLLATLTAGKEPGTYELGVVSMHGNLPLVSGFLCGSTLAISGDFGLEPTQVVTIS